MFSVGSSDPKLRNSSTKARVSGFFSSLREGRVTTSPPPMSPARAMTRQKALQMLSLDTLPISSSGRKTPEPGGSSCPSWAAANPQARPVSRRVTISVSCSLMWVAFSSPLYSWMSLQAPTMRFMKPTLQVPPQVMRWVLANRVTNLPE